MVTAPGAGVHAYCGYFAGIDVKGNALVLGKADGAAWTPIANAIMVIPLVKDTKYRMKVVAEGNRIRVYLEDMFVPLLDENDGTWSQGIVGLRAHQTVAKFDNIIATERL